MHAIKKAQVQINSVWVWCRMLFLDMQTSWSPVDFPNLTEPEPPELGTNNNLQMWLKGKLKVFIIGL